MCVLMADSLPLALMFICFRPACLDVHMCVLMTNSSLFVFDFRPACLDVHMCVLMTNSSLFVFDFRPACLDVHISVPLPEAHRGLRLATPSGQPQLQTPTTRTPLSRPVSRTEIPPSPASTSVAAPSARSSATTSGRGRGPEEDQQLESRPGPAGVPWKVPRSPSMILGVISLLLLLRSMILGAIFSDVFLRSLRFFHSSALRWPCGGPAVHDVGALRSMMWECLYGSRLFEEQDRVLLASLMDTMLCDAALQPQGFALSEDGIYRVPVEMDPEPLLVHAAQFLGTLPASDPPVAFGLHKNVELSLLHGEATTLLASLASVQPRGTGLRSSWVPSAIPLPPGSHTFLAAGALSAAAAIIPPPPSGTPVPTHTPRLAGTAAIFRSAASLAIPRVPSTIPVLMPTPGQSMATRGSSRNLLLMSSAGVSGSNLLAQHLFKGLAGTTAGGGGGAEEIPSAEEAVEEPAEDGRTVEKEQEAETRLVAVVEGLATLSQPLAGLLDSIQRLATPPAWLSYAYPSSLHALGPWLADLSDRVAFFRRWIDSGPPAAFLLRAFINPRRFLSALQDDFAQRHLVPPEQVQLKTEVLRQTLDTLKKGPPEGEGCYIHGLFLQGARWDEDRRALDEARPGELFGEMPVWDFPVGEGFITNVTLPCGSRPAAHWIRRGVALVSGKPLLHVRDSIWKAQLRVLELTAPPRPDGPGAAFAGPGGPPTPCSDWSSSRTRGAGQS
ncbi:putative dynein heavy chain 1; axonemal [Paratrimastix pyriformis]|uniref:Dynein heavy chain 1 n=1 Tax=Paratrimastix pyriformis TaxID=342808 RepID=A0ABQ8U8M3_9EUKA|nr:putative dynein heavy chain 1; axonemal [Paratrimastix pyriformis]